MVPHNVAFFLRNNIMKRYEMIKSHDEFNEIIHKGNKISNKYFVIFEVEQSNKKPRFGIAVGKKMGNAVVRNKIKRQMRMIIDNNRNLFKNFHNYIIMVKRECLEINFFDLEKEFIKTLGKEIK